MAEEPLEEQLMQAAITGNSDAVERLLTGYRHRLKHMIRVYWDDRLSARMDPSDVYQEAMLLAVHRLPRYLNAAARPVPLYVWLRGIAWECLMQMQHAHLGVKKRTVLREQCLTSELSEALTSRLATILASQQPVPDRVAIDRETVEQVRRTLMELPEMHRQTLVLRYLEQLDASESSAVLGITRAAFAKRHLRALRRLRERLSADQQKDSI